MTTVTFTDKLGIGGRAGDQVIVPVCDDRNMPQLAVAEVVEVVVREPNPFASEISVRTRIEDDESRVYEPYEVIVLTGVKDRR